MTPETYNGICNENLPSLMNEMRQKQKERHVRIKGKSLIDTIYDGDLKFY